MFNKKKQINSLKEDIEDYKRHVDFCEKTIREYYSNVIKLQAELDFIEKWKEDYFIHQELTQLSIDSLTEEVNRKDDDIETLLYELYTANKRNKTLEENNKEAYIKLYSTSIKNGKLIKENEKLKLNSKYGTLIHAVCPECSEEISDLLGDLYESMQHEEYLKAKLCFAEEINKMQNKMIKKLKEKLDKQ